VAITVAIVLLYYLQSLNHPENGEKNMPTPDQCKATYHGGIGSLLRAAYQREFTMLEMGKCKTKFRKFDKWYATLNADQRQRVDKVLVAEYGE
jgi:hypothetical protein